MYKEEKGKAILLVISLALACIIIPIIGFMTSFLPYKKAVIIP